jgi:hypothetical protein
MGARISFRAAGRCRSIDLALIRFDRFCYDGAWTQRKQGLHDMIASTLVLNGTAPASSSRSDRNPAAIAVASAPDRLSRKRRDLASRRFFHFANTKYHPHCIIADLDFLI